jgi:hypothetical protein
MAKKEEAELMGFINITGSAGIEPNSGEAVAEPLTVFVNEEPTNVGTKHAQRVHGERIEIWKKTLPETVKNGKMNVVTKKWKEIQKPYGGEQGSISQAPSRFQPPSGESGKHDLTPTEMLKNMIDNLDRRVQGVSNWGKVGLVLGAIGLCGFIVALAAILR